MATDSSHASVAEDHGGAWYVLEQAFAVGALLFFTGAFIQLAFSPGGMSSVALGGDPVSTRLQYVVYGLTTILCAIHWDTIRHGVASSGPSWLLVGLCVLSVAWSSSPAISFKSAVWLTGSGAFALYFSQRFTEDQQVRLLAAVAALLVLSSLLLVLFWPDLGLEPGEARGAWRGAFTRKNGLGRAMALSILVFLLALRTGSWDRLPTAVGLAFALALLALSDSATGLVSAVVGLIAVVSASRLRRSRHPRARLALRLLLLTILFCAIVWMFRDQLLGSIGRDTRLTGRDTLWVALLAKILVEPWLGYGHLAFWRGADAQYLDIWRLVGWSPPHAHNGFIDTTLELGLLGLVTLFLVFASGMWGALARLRSEERGRDGVWPFTYLIFFFTINLTETSTLRHSNIYWILFIVAIANARRLPAAPVAPRGLAHV